MKYYVSGDYLKQKGVIKGYQYHRASLRSNIDATITDFLTAGVNLFLTSNNYDGGRASLTAASKQALTEPLQKQMVIMKFIQCLASCFIQIQC